MAQSTLLSSQVQNRKGFVVSVERTIRLAEFESLRVAPSESFPEGMDHHEQAYRLIHERVEQWATAAKPKETLPVVENHKPKESPRVSDNHALPPRPAVSKPPSLTVETRPVEVPLWQLARSKPPSVTVETLRERLAKWLPDLEITDGFDGFSVKPKRYLGETWEAVNQEIRSLGSHWTKGKTPKDGSWRIPKG